MGRAVGSDNCGNTCPEATRNAGNAVAGRFTLTGSDGVCPSMTAFRHGESDSIVGSGHSGGIHTSVACQSRFLCAVKIPAITACQRSLKTGPETLFEK